MCVFLIVTAPREAVRHFKVSMAATLLTFISCSNIAFYCAKRDFTLSEDVVTD